MTEIAVVVPTHNRPTLLDDTLRSILAQRDVDMEVVVVDDGSSDPSAVRGVIERVAQVEQTLRREIQEAGNTLAAYIGEVEDRLTRGTPQ